MRTLSKLIRRNKDKKEDKKEDDKEEKKEEKKEEEKKEPEDKKERKDFKRLSFFGSVRKTKGVGNVSSFNFLYFFTSLLL